MFHISVEILCIFCYLVKKMLFVVFPLSMLKRIVLISKAFSLGFCFFQTFTLFFKFVCNGFLLCRDIFFTLKPNKYNLEHKKIFENNFKWLPFSIISFGLLGKDKWIFAELNTTLTLQLKTGWAKEKKWDEVKQFEEAERDTLLKKRASERQREL